MIPGSKTSFQLAPKPLFEDTLHRTFVRSFVSSRDGNFLLCNIDSFCLDLCMFSPIAGGRDVYLLFYFFIEN